MLERPGFLRQVSILVRKDLVLEARSGEVTLTSTFFALLVVVMSSMSFHGGPRTGRVVLSGVIWVAVAFAAVLALGRSWAREREGGALTGLLTTPLSPAALFLAKSLVLTMFLVAIELVVFPLAAVFFSVDLPKYALGLGCLAALATPGIAATGTLFGVMTVRTSARDLLLSIVLFPLLLPVLLTAVSATRALLEGAPLAELDLHFRLIFVFDVVFVAAGLSLFGTLVED
jgi:heme exporter protein B